MINAFIRLGRIECRKSDQRDVDQIGAFVTDRTIASHPSLPLAYKAWLTAMLLAQAGNAALYFLVVWESVARYGGIVPAVVLLSVVVPRALLVGTGGRFSDRRGARTAVVASDLAMTVVGAVLVVLGLTGQLILPWLVAIAVSMGVIEAFFVPGSRTLPHRLLSPATHAYGVNVRRYCKQVGIVIGGVGAGILLSFDSGVALVGILVAVTMAGSFIVDARVLRDEQVERPRATDDGQTEPAGTGISSSALLTSPHLRFLVIAIGIIGAALLSAGTLLVPVLGAQEWGVVGTAAVFASVNAGALIALAFVNSRRPSAHPLRAIASATCAAGVALAPVLVLPGNLGVAVGSFGFMGFGLGLITAYGSPLILGNVRPDQASSAQAVVTLTQTISLTVTLPLVGALAVWAGAVVALALCATLLVFAGLATAFAPEDAAPSSHRAVEST